VFDVQEWWGLNKNMEELADELAHKGFRTLVPDLYRGKVAKNREEAGHLVSGLDWPAATSDIRGAVQYLKNNGCQKVGVVGFCMGGALAIVSSTTPEPDAAACFYGIPDVSTLDLNKISIPIQLHFGENDDMKGFSDPETAKNLEQKLKSLNKTVDLYIYQGVGHAFTNKDRGETYNKDVRELALKRTEEFFKKYLA